MNNQIRVGDNLQIMQSMESESIELVLTDPPFNSKQDYGAFDDRWSSDSEYLQFMEARLVEMHRLLKPTGSIYLHCDWHVSHHLRLLLDKIFGASKFRNEIIWAYTGPGFYNAKQFSRKHDTIYFYSKSATWTFNGDAVRVPYKSGPRWNSKRFGTSGSSEKMLADHARGKLPEDWWSEFSPVGRLPKERLGYPTQKPVALYERIVKASSNPGDILLDPFAGSGTSLIAAELHGRRWIGIDSNPQVKELLQLRLERGR